MSRNELTLEELIECLQALQEDHGPDIPVRILSDDFSPWELRCDGAEAAKEPCPANWEDHTDCPTCEGTGEIARVYLFAGNQIRFATDEIKSQLMK